MMPSERIVHCVKELVRRGMKISFAESATAGRLVSEFALVKDSGKILMGGIVCYDVSVKCDLLNIPKVFIEKFTAESAEVTKALSENLRVHFKSDVFVAVTGLASPGGSETPEKPVGTMFIHILMPESYISHREVFEGSPEEIILKTADKVCTLILKKLDSQTPLRKTG